MGIVPLRLEQAIETGRRGAVIDATDLSKTLLSVSDLLDSPVSSEAGLSLLDAPQTLLKAQENQMVIQLAASVNETEAACGNGPLLRY